MKVAVVLGTRPEAIKMAPVVRRLQREQAIETCLLSTGQHREMLDPILELFELTVDHELGAMRPGQSLNSLMDCMVSQLDAVLAAERPDRVLVHGDTTTAAAAALAAFHHRIPVGHVEAGLRTGQLDQPWPEGMSRRVVDVIADQLYAPTASARENLLAENLGEKRIAITGSTVIDALLYMAAKIKGDAALRTSLARRFGFLAPDKNLILVTGQPREKFGRGFADICRALGKLGERTDTVILYPVHLNPNVRGPVLQMLGGRPRIHLIEPVVYAEFVYLMQRATLILTDSDGVQEEAPSLGKPVLVMRDVTDWPEAVAAGTARLAGTDPERIVAMASAYLDDPALRASAAERSNPYGNGEASERIVEEILA